MVDVATPLPALLATSKVLSLLVKRKPDQMLLAFLLRASDARPSLLIPFRQFYRLPSALRKSRSTRARF